MDGFIAINKPESISSHDAVSKLRKLLSIKRIGHAGTLDPDATGVLVMAVGRATRVLPLLNLEPKKYYAHLQLGSSTTTQDSRGEVIKNRDTSHITLEQIAKVLVNFRGEILQIPPMYSALHHEGQRLYELARKGIEVERKPRSVTIFEINMCNYDMEKALIELDISCSSGTYVRTLCHDIGEELGVGGYMAVLDRYAVGPFTSNNSIDMNKEFSVENILNGIIDIKSALFPEGAPSINIIDEQLSKVMNGNSIEINVNIVQTDTRPMPLLYNDAIAALANIKENYAFPTLVFNPPAPIYPNKLI